ncbi:MAG: hypothetical protein SFT93_04040 [Rickettsiaceae bacterium]|nr:hypothetical protein [Rickettsiaceae bacterium]
MTIMVSSPRKRHCHPLERGDPGNMSSPRRRGSREYNSSRFPPPRE